MTWRVAGDAAGSKGAVMGYSAHRQITALAIVVLLSVGCGDDSPTDVAIDTTAPTDEVRVTTASTSPETSSPETSTTEAAKDAEMSVCPEGGCAVVEELDVDYGDRDAGHERLDIYAPAEAGEWPVVVLAHGKTLSRKTMGPLAEVLASLGAVVYSASYLDTEPLVEAVEDMSCAIRYASSTAAEHGGRTDRIVVVGHSLGGAIGFLAATSGEDHTPSWCRAPDEWVDVTGFVGYEGVYDIASTARAIDITGLEQSDPETWHSVNPYSQIGRHDELTVRLIHGIDDDRQWYDVLPEVSEDFERSLSEADYDVELITVDGASHSGWNEVDRGFAQIVNTTLALTEA